MTTYAELVDQIRSYTETSSDVLTTTVVNDIIEQAELRIFREVDLDCFRAYQFTTLTQGNEFVTLPGATPSTMAFVRTAAIYPTAGSDANERTYLLQKDISYMTEYWPNRTTQGKPKYYAMFGAATGESDTTSGRIFLAPTPNTNYKFRVHYNVAPALLENDDTNYISLNFPNGLLYCCLAETYGFLKGPADMLTLYEQKYRTEVQKFANEQVGRRRRDDYTDGTVRIPITSANP